MFHFAHSSSVDLNGARARHTSHRMDRLPAQMKLLEGHGVRMGVIEVFREAGGFTLDLDRAAGDPG